MKATCSKPRCRGLVPPFFCRVVRSATPLIAVLAVASALPTPRAAACAQTASPPAGFSERAARFLVSARVEPARRFKVAPDGTITFTTPDPGKYLWNQIFALLDADSSGEQSVPGVSPRVTVRQLIHALFTFPDLFHFNADGPAACLMQYPGLVSPEDRRFFFEGHPRSLLARTEGVNYNLFTGEGTENHVAMSRFAAYLLCQNWLADHPGDVRAQTGMRQTRDYILYRAARVPRGGTGEWNSSTYYGYALRGPLLCSDWARDATVKAACRRLLDAYAADMALGYFSGVSARPESRGARHDSVDAERDQIAFLWWGDSPVAPRGATNAVWAALASYRPPAALARVADKTDPFFKPGRAYYNSHPSYLLDREGESRETLYIGPGGAYAVSCAYLPYAGYTGATQQFLPMKIVARSPLPEQSALTVIGNDSSRGDDGVGRGPYTQWAQFRNVVLQMTFVPPDASARTQNANAITALWQNQWRDSFRRRFRRKGDEEASHGPTPAPLRNEPITSYLLLPKEAVVVPDNAADENAGRVFVRLNDTFLAVQTLSGAAPIQTTGRLSVPVTPGALNGFAVEVGSLREQSDFGVFQNRVRSEARLDCEKLAASGAATYRNLAGNVITMRYAFDAASPPVEPIFDWGYIAPDAPTDEPRPFATAPPFLHPLYSNAAPSGDLVSPVAALPNRSAPRPLAGWGRIPVVMVDNKPLGGADFLNMSRFWPLVKEEKK